MNQNLVLIIILLLAGIILRRLRVLPQDASQTLNSFIIYLSLPAMIFVQAPKLSFSFDLIGVILTPWIALILSVLLVLLISKVLGFSRSLQGALLLMVPLGNTSFLGFPMVETFFGKQGIPYAMLYDQLGSFFILSFYGSFILSVYTGESHFQWGLLLKKLITFPPFLALVFALLLKETNFLLSFNKILTPIAGTLVPLAMVAAGYQLKVKLPRQSYLALGSGLACKLILIPLIIFGLVKAFDLNELPMQVAIFEAGMPPMISAGALAINAKLEPDLIASLVGVGVILSLVTLPLLHALL